MSEFQSTACDTTIDLSVSSFDTDSTSDSSSSCGSPLNVDSPTPPQQDEEPVESDDEVELGTINYNLKKMTSQKRVLVTGGAGFIGSSVAEYLLERGDFVVIVDEVNDYYNPNLKKANLEDLLAKYSDELLKVYIGDICDVPFIEKVFAETKPNHICHMAARAGVRPSIEDPFVYIHSNVEATTRLLELARTNGCISFVFASSSSVYGGSKREEFAETDIVDFPVSPYAATKKACELIAYTYHNLYGLDIAGLRFFTVYGPRGRPDMAPFKFIDRVSRGIEIQQFGDGSSSRDYTYIDDIVDGVVRSIDQPQGYQIYNLGNGNPIGLRRFISIVEETVGKDAIIRQLPDQPGDVPRTCADISKARNMLGYSPKVNFEEGIRRTVEWYSTSYKPEQEGETHRLMKRAVSTINIDNVC
mmetsp:Transcript_30123/g.39668  ORF Transcript_30123/g.39668 Transcript_30123/m.39668 type:complete len:416 (+) Transcript_30123:348-1595(+)